MLVYTKSSSRIVLAVFGTALMLSVVATLTLESLVAFGSMVGSFLGMLYAWGINHYVDPSPHRPRKGLKDSLIKDYWLIGRIFAVGTWLMLVVYFHVAELGMKGLPSDPFLVLFHPLPIWMYTLAPAAIIVVLWLANIHGRRYVS